MTAARWILSTLFVLFTLGLWFDLPAFLVTSWDRIPATYQFDQGEGLMIALAAESAAGRSIYPDIEAGPALINNYPPLYLRLMEQGGDRPLDWLRFGRQISMCAALLAALFLGSLASLCCPRPGLARLVAFSFAATSFLALEPVRNWGSLARVDMLGIAAVITAILCLRVPGAFGRALGLLFFLAALFVKHSLFAAPLALVVVIGVRRPREALAWAATALLLGGLGLFYLQGSSEGQFLFHVVQANQTAFSWPLLVHHLGETWKDAWPLVAPALLGLFVAKKKDARRPFLIVWGAFASISLAGLGKTGSSSNYALEILAFLALTAGIGMGALAGYVAEAPKRRGVLVLVFLAQLYLFMPDLEDGRFRARVPARDLELEAGLESLQASLRSVEGEVLSWDMSLPVLAGKRLLYHPFVIPDLERRGLHDDQELLARIEAGEFAVFVTSFDLADEERLLRETRGLAPLFSERLLRTVRGRYRLFHSLSLPAHLGGAYVFYIPK